MDESIRCWLVERSLEDGRVLTLTYATPDGTQSVTRQRSIAGADDGVPAAVQIEAATLHPVENEEQVDRYREEVARVRDRHAPDDYV